MGIVFDTNAVNELEKMLIGNADAADKFTEPMLEAGGEVLANAHNKALKRMAFSSRSTGALAGSVKPGKPRKLKSGGAAITVYPHGQHLHGNTRRGQKSRVSLAHAGFLLEYGTSTMQARPWRAKADAEAAANVQEAMAKKWLEVSKHGG